MDDLSWTRLCDWFPAVPARVRMETPGGRPAPGVRLAAHARPVIALAFSADERLVAVSGGGMIPGAVDLRVFEVETRALRWVCHAHSMGVFSLAIDPRTELLASASHDYSVILWDLARQDSIFLMGAPDAGVSRKVVAFAGDHLVVADGMTFAGARASLWDVNLATGQTRALLTLEKELGFEHLVALADGRLVVSIDEARAPGHPELAVLTLQGERRRISRLRTSLYDLTAAPNGVLIGTGDDGEGHTEVFALDLGSGERRATRKLGGEIGASVAASPSGDQVAVAYQNAVELCATGTLAPVARLELGEEVALSVAWSPAGRWIGVGTIDRTLRLFDARTGREHLGSGEGGA